MNIPFVSIVHQLRSFWAVEILPKRLCVMLQKVTAEWHFTIICRETIEAFGRLFQFVQKKNWLKMGRLSKGDPSSYSEPGIEFWIIAQYFHPDEYRNCCGRNNIDKKFDSTSRFRVFFLQILCLFLLSFTLRESHQTSRRSILECWFYWRNHKWRGVATLWHRCEGNRSHCKYSVQSLSLIEMKCIMCA